MTHSCPDCGRERSLSAAQLSRIRNGHRTGRCLGCASLARTRPAIERFSGRIAVDPETICWNWTGSLTPSGYGSFPLRRGRSHSQLAHRFMWEYLHGPVSDGMEIDHLCFNRRCVNPDHLEPVNPAENVRRWKERVRARTTCPRGHAFTPATLYVDPRHGTKVCRICRNEGMRRARDHALATRQAITTEKAA